MYKFACLVIVCLSAGVLAEETDSQLAILSSTAQDEVAKIPASLSVYSDFCIQTREQLYQTIRTESNGVAAEFFKLMIGKVADVAKATIETQELGLERIANQIEHPEAEIAGTDGSEAQEIIAEGQRQIQEVEIQPKSLFYGIYSLFAASANTASKNAAEAIGKLAENFKNTKHIFTAAFMVCQRAGQFNKLFRDEFEKYNADIAAESRVNVGKAVTFEDVKCLTAGRVDSLDALCQFASATREPVTRMFNRATARVQA